ncbi:uncharacterized protein DS421_14g466090 [Arachis hypogaea]|nr:uncharacterized protein DS421_14g466090 [Arachis hypogaea]
MMVGGSAALLPCRQNLPPWPSELRAELLPLETLLQSPESHRCRSPVAAAAGGGYQGYRQTGSEAIATSFLYYSKYLMFRKSLALVFGCVWLMNMSFGNVRSSPDYYMIAISVAMVIAKVAGS